MQINKTLNNIHKKRKLCNCLKYLIIWLRKNLVETDLMNQLYYIIVLVKLTKINKKDKIFKNEVIDIITSFLKNEISIQELKLILEYKKDKNYYTLLELNKSSYINIIDLDISFLPNFLEYDDFTNILFWIIFCKVNDKKSKKKNSFLYDIYLFQKETNKIFKTEFLIIVLEKMINYIHYHDYKK